MNSYILLFVAMFAAASALETEDKIVFEDSSAMPPVASTKAPAAMSTDQPTTKSVPASTGAPTAKSTTGAPTAQSTTGAPTAKSTTGTPTAKSTTGAPVTKANTTAAPVTKANTTVAPVTKANTTVAPVTKANTTVAPTTSNATTPNTTKAASTTLKPTTTIPAPTTTPTVPPPTYDVKENNTVCIRIQGDISFTVPYKSNGTKATATIKLPAHNATATGRCFDAKKNKTTADIHLSWDSSSLVFVLGFKLNNDGSWATVAMNYSFNTTDKAFKMASGGVIVGGLQDGADLKMYHANKQRSYLCEQKESISLTNGVVVHFDHLRIQPLPLNGTQFDKPEMCAASSDSNTTSSIVPIAVGCALAGLIVIVLIAYLIGRRRGNRGYQQV